MKLIESEFNGVSSVEIVTDKARIVITTGIGPRIAFLGKPNGGNLLLWEPGKYFRNNWELIGGHRVWVTRPFADECEDTYYLDTGKCEVVKTDSGWIVTAPIDPANNTRRGIAVTAKSENLFEIDNFLTNAGDMLFSGGVWALTCTIPSSSSKYAIPLSNGGVWDFCKVVLFARWDGHVGNINDDQFSYTSDMMILSPKGKENKRMIMAEQGIIAMHDPDRDILFAKKSVYDPNGRYPHECNLAVYVGPENFMVEMETMGSESTVRPGDTIHNYETWVLDSARTQLDSGALQSLFEG